MSYLTPPCPSCGKSVPFKQTQWGLGKPFRCEGCETELVIPTNLWIGVGAFVAFFLFEGLLVSTDQKVILAIALIAIILLVSRLFLMPKKPT